MPDYVIYDPTTTPVSNLVTQILRSFDEGQEETLPPTRVKDPDLTGVDLDALMKWTGTVVVNLTPAEVNSVTAAQQAADLAALKKAAKDIFLVPTGAQNQAISLGFATMRDMMLSEINILRAAVVPALNARTLTQFNTTFKSTYEAKIDALS
jgi:hypothetical protein